MFNHRYFYGLISVPPQGIAVVMGGCFCVLINPIASVPYREVQGPLWEVPLYRQLHDQDKNNNFDRARCIMRGIQSENSVSQITQ